MLCDFISVGFDRNFVPRYSRVHNKVHYCISSDLRLEVGKINHRVFTTIVSKLRPDITKILIFNSQAHDIASEGLAAFFFPKTPYSSSL